MSPNAKDPLRVLEAVYSFAPDDVGWLEGLADALEPFGWTEGLAVYTSTLGETPVVTAAVNRTRLPTEALRAMPTLLPAPFYRRLHAPMPLTHSHDIFPRVAAELDVAAFWPERDNPQLPTVSPQAAWAVGGGDADVETTLVTFHCSIDDEPSRYDRQTLDQLGAHIGSALRLRRFIRTTPAADDDNVGAVLAPDGTLQFAGDDAKSETEHAPLIDAVRRSEKAKLRHATAEERLDVWTALVDGKWSILESVERDGKRLLLAYRNNPAARALRELTTRERIVGQYAALGHPLKYIAYELGISIATAAGNLDIALRKLGVATRAELIQLFARSNDKPAG